MSQGMQQYVLGLNFAYHESSACLMDNGKIIAAVEEERFNRVRHAKAATIEQANLLPFMAIEQCLKVAGINMADVDAIGCSFLPQQRYIQNQGLLAADDSAEGWGTETGELLFRDHLLAAPDKISAYFDCDIGQRWQWFSHHLCHVAGAYAQSGFRDAALLCVDGIAEFDSTSWGEAEGSTLTMLGALPYPHSLGLLWEKFSMFLGFSEYDATKTMSLAAFGSAARYRDKMQTVLMADGYRFQVDDKIAALRSAGFDGFSQHFSLASITAEQARTQEYFDLIAALQEQTEHILLNLSRHLRAETGRTQLCYAGGVALNCLANRHICCQSGFEQVFIQPAANDAGTAVGAAFLLAGENALPQSSPHPVVTSTTHAAYLATDYDVIATQTMLKEAGATYSCPQHLEEETAELLAAGNIVGWFQGRMEFGPRALGHRSILADPRNLEAKRIMDRVVKFRDAFRPYAPSILSEHADAWFDIPSAARPSTRYMLVAAQVHDAKAHKIPAVLHIDGSSRIHLVYQHDNPRYHALLTAFYRLTGVPMLLNSSFNSLTPIVETPQQALDTFQRTAIDVLIVGDNMLLKSQSFSEEYQRRMALLQQGNTPLDYSALQYQISRW